MFSKTAILAVVLGAVGISAQAPPTLSGRPARYACPTQNLVNVAFTALVPPVGSTTFSCIAVGLNTGSQGLPVLNGQTGVTILTCTYSTLDGGLVPIANVDLSLCPVNAALVNLRRRRHAIERQLSFEDLE